MLEREDVQPAWHEYTHHEFTKRMGDGTLPPETFKYYMIQDYLYLVGRRLKHSTVGETDHAQIHFARANALAGYKAKTLDDIAGVGRFDISQYALLMRV